MRRDPRRRTLGPRAAFGSAAILLAFIAFPPWSGGLRLTMGFLLLALLGTVLVRSAPRWPSPGRDPDLTRSRRLWVAAAVVGFLLRWVRWDSLFPWPNLDEGTYGFIAMMLAERGWDGRLLYNVAQIPPLTHWALAAWFKGTGASLTSLWAFPAVLSTAAAGIGYPAFRAFLDRREARIATILFLLSFWPVYVGRFATPLVLFMFLHLAALAVLGAGRRASLARRGSWLLLLGLVNGIGFFSYLGWAFVFLYFAASVVLDSKREGVPWTGPLLRFLVPSLLLPLPMFVYSLRTGVSHYYSDLLFWNGPGGAWPLSALQSLGALLWGADIHLFAYKPMWGGLLDPVLGALFLMGLALLAMDSRRGLRRDLLAGLAFGLAPAVLTMDVEVLRLVPALPFVLGIVAVGTAAFLARLRSDPPGLPLLHLLLAVVLLGAYHLFVAYPGYWDRTPERESFYHSKEYAQAHRILSKKAEESGPGRVLYQMHPDPYDQTLAVASRPYGVHSPPRPGEERPQWAAFIFDIHYVHFLKSRFTNAEWTHLGSFSKSGKSRWWLAVVPLHDPDRTVFRGWDRFHREMQGIAEMTVNHAIGQPRTRIFGELDRLREAADGDPFLISVAMETAAMHHAAGGRPEKVGEDLARAIKEGYPAAHLFNELGSWFASQGKWEEARAAWERALKTPINQTPALENLRLLEERSGR